MFTSHMVFAANKTIRIFGEGRGNVKITFANREICINSVSDRWLAEFPPMDYGGPYTMKVEFEDKTLLLEDIHIGEVYLFCGQSNMDFAMRYLKDFSPCNYSDNGDLRFYTVKDKSWKSYFSKDDGWMPCKSDELLYRSALAYFAGDKIIKNKNIKVGMAVCAFGASVIESWVPEGAFSAIGINLSDEQKFPDHTMEEYSRWNKDGYLYDNELSDLMPFSFTSIVWYQGESDVSVDEGNVYCEELCQLIRIWRNGFCDDNLPFTVIQIADFIGRDQKAWSLVQDAQLEVQNRLHNVKTVISCDVSENDEIHPPTKDKLANRIAEYLLADLK